MQNIIQTTIDRLQAFQVGKRDGANIRDALLSNYDAAKGECGELERIAADLLVAAAEHALYQIDEGLDETSVERLRLGLSDAMHELLYVDEDHVLTQMEAA